MILREALVCIIPMLSCLGNCAVSRIAVLKSYVDPVVEVSVGEPAE